MFCKSARRNGFSGLRVDLLEEIGRAENQASVFAVLGFPIVHPSAGEPLNTFVDPDRLSGRRIECHERARRATAVDDPAHDERIEVGLAGRVRPGDLKLVHIGLGDLLRGDEPGAVGAAGVVAPFALDVPRLAEDR